MPSSQLPGFALGDRYRSAVPAIVGVEVADSADRGLGDRRCARLCAVGRSDLPGGCPVAADPDQGPGGCQCQGAVCPDSAGSAGSRRQRAGSLLRQAGVFRSPSRAIPAIERRGPVPEQAFGSSTRMPSACSRRTLKKGPPGGAFLPLVHAVSPGHGWCRHSQRHARVDHRERAPANPGRPPGTVSTVACTSSRISKASVPVTRLARKARSPGCWKRTASGRAGLRMSSGRCAGG